MMAASVCISVRKCLLPALVMSSLLAACVGNPLRSHDKEMGDTLSLMRSGDLAAAVANIDKNGTKDLLYYFERGEVLRLDNQYEESLNTWLQADETVRMWEDEYRTNPTKALGDVASYIISDRTRRYDGQDYEKVFLSAKLALDHIMMGNDDLARIEMKKTFERETLIKNFREQEYDKIQEESQKKSIAFKPTELLENGYPMDKLEDAEVNTLKNGYQNAFAHYLAGYYFEMKGEPSLSAPGYRNAAELRPDSALARAKAKNGQGKVAENEADVLFVVESGQAPAWKSVTIALPLPIDGNLVVVPLSFPVVAATKSYVPTTIGVGGRALPVETLVNVDALAKRQLKDQLPGIIGRTAIRGVVKAAAQVVAQKKAGKLAGAAVAVGGTATEQADDRAWRTLPARVSIARAVLPKGEQSITFRTGRNTYSGTVTIGDGKINIIPIRIIGGAVYIGQKQAQGKYADLPASDVFNEVEEEVALGKVTAKPVEQKAAPAPAPASKTPAEELKSNKLPKLR